MKIIEFVGYGIKVVINGKEVYVGNIWLLLKYGIFFFYEISDMIEIIVLCVMENKYLGYFLLVDILKLDVV